MSRFLRSSSHFAMQAGIAANNIVKGNDHGLWMRREKVHGFRGYGHADPRIEFTPSGASVAGNGDPSDRRETWNRSGGSADAAEDRLIEQLLG